MKKTKNQYFSCGAAGIFTNEVKTAKSHKIGNKIKTMWRNR